MKKITLFAGICLGLLATACGKKALDLPATDTLSYGLNSNITLIKGFNEFNTQDYIIDPAKVTRSALENAASVSAMVLTTESLVTDKPEPPAPAMPGPDMGGMY